MKKSTGVRGPVTTESAAEGTVDSAIYAAWAERLERLGGLTKTSRILDIDCGAGHLAQAIGERFNWANKYVGLGPNKAETAAAIARVSKAHRNFEFSYLDVRGETNPKGKLAASKAKFPVSTKAFDFALSISLFTHMFEAETSAYVKETFRSLAPNGVFLATFFLIPPNYDKKPPDEAARFRFVREIAPGVRVLRPEQPSKAVAFDEARVAKIFQSAGFVDFKHLPGSWNGDLNAQSSQDIVIVRKKK